MNFMLIFGISSLFNIYIYIIIFDIMYELLHKQFLKNENMYRKFSYDSLI